MSKRSEFPSFYDYLQHNLSRVPEAQQAPAEQPTGPLYEDAAKLDEPRVCGLDVGSAESDRTVFATGFPDVRMVFIHSQPQPEFDHAAKLDDGIKQAAELFVQKSSTFFAIVDDEGCAVDLFDSYEAARQSDNFMDGDQIIEVNGTCFVRA